jgi:hypothetical protein
MMNNQRPGMFIPALIGGAVAGVLTAIPLIGCLCCIWMIGGGMLAAYLLNKDSPAALSTGDGAIVGIFSGIIAAVVDFFVSIPFDAMANDIARGFLDKLAEYSEDMPAGFESLMDSGSFGPSIFWNIFGLLIAVVIFSALGALGGVIGMSLFKKKGTQKLEQGSSDASQNPSDRQP